MEANFLYLSCITNSTTKEYETKKSLFDMPKSRNHTQMTNIIEENFNTICNRIQELIDLLENGAPGLPPEQWEDIVNRITKLNRMLEQLKR